MLSGHILWHEACSFSQSIYCGTRHVRVARAYTVSRGMFVLTGHTLWHEACSFCQGMYCGTRHVRVAWASQVARGMFVLP